MVDLLSPFTQQAVVPHSLVEFGHDAGGPGPGGCLGDPGRLAGFLTEP